MKDAPQLEMPRAQRIYGEIIYWMTIIACIVCMIGPAISVANPEQNVLNPYNLFNSIFEGKTPEQVWTEVGGGRSGNSPNWRFQHTR